MIIRKATKEDIPGLNILLKQVCLVHHQGRPDLFQYGKKKYTSTELEALLEDASRPIFVAVNECGSILGHAFCIHQEFHAHSVLTDVKTLYIDDICVLEDSRGQQVGKRLYEYVHQYAIENNYYNITLNVWSFNNPAIKFYEQCGFTPQKIGMEVILAK